MKEIDVFAVRDVLYEVRANNYYGIRNKRPKITRLAKPWYVVYRDREAFFLTGE